VATRGAALREWLPEHLESNPDLTLKEHCQAFSYGTSLEVSEATVSRQIARLPGEWPLKKSRKWLPSAMREPEAYGGGSSLASRT
jgi:hypothetical protein